MVNAVSNVLRGVSTKASIPALEGVLIQARNNQITLNGYDLEIGIITTIEATVQQEGEIVVSAKLLADIVRKLPEEIMELRTDDKCVTYIKSGTADYQIIGISSDDYPELPRFETEDELVINAGLLKSMIRETIYAAAEVRDTPVYTGSYYEMTENKLRIVAVDGFRMAIRTEAVKCEKVPPFVVPAKTQAEVLRLILDDDKDVKLNIGKRHIAYEVDNYKVVSRLIEGSFLNYNNTIPKETNTEVIVNTRRFLDSVERMSLITSDKIKIPLHCTMDEAGITLMCTTAIGKAKDFIEATHIGKPVTIGFNHRFLIDALKNTECDEIKLLIKGPLDPMIITPVKGDSFLFLVVPMRISA